MAPWEPRCSRIRPFPVIRSTYASSSWRQLKLATLLSITIYILRPLAARSPIPAKFMASDPPNATATRTLRIHIYLRSHTYRYIQTYACECVGSIGQLNPISSFFFYSHRFPENITQLVAIIQRL